MRFLHRWLTWLGLCAALIALAGARADAQPRPQLRLDTQSLQLAPPTGAEPTPAAAAEPATPEPAANAAEGTAPSAESVPATPPPPPSGDGCQRVVRVRFLGLRRVSADDLRDSTRVHTGDCLDRARVARDARTLWDLGFFRDVRIGFEESEGGVELRYHLAERPTIHAVRFEGYDDVDEDKLRETIDLRDGATLSDAALRRNVQKLLDLYEEKGFFLARVTHTVVPVTGDRNQIDVVFHIVEGPQVQVRNIQFIGNHSLTDDELRGSMTTSTSGFFSFITSSGTFREEAFRNDMDMLHAAYYDRGHLTVDIGTPRVALTPDRRFIDIVIPIREGPRYRVNRLRVQEVDEDGNEVEPLGGRRAMRERVHAVPGDFFSRSVIARDIVAVQTAYRDAGYASVEVTPDIQPDTAHQTVDLTVRIVRGPLVTIHRIEVRGNAKTSERVIRREMQIFEGERYNETSYQASRRRVMALGFFERVDLSTEPVEGHPEWLVVNVEVAERPTGTFQVGAGFSSVENLIFTAQIQQLNLFGRGQSLTLQAQLSSLRQIFSLRFVEPYFLDSNWTLAADVYNTVRAYTDFSRTSTGGSLTFGYPILSQYLRFFLSYTGEEVGANSNTSTGLFGQTTLPSAFRSLPLANIFLSGFTSAIGASVAFDNRDNRLTPTDGFYARLGVDVADPTFGSQNVYTRVSGWFRFYHPIASGFVFKMNVQGGYVFSQRAQGVPIFERYFLGGVFDVRGYQLRTISPRLQLPLSQDPNAPLVSNGAVIGGNVQLYYNLEIEFPILTAVGLRGVVFQDAGNTFNTESQYCGAGGTSLPSATDPCTHFWDNPLNLRYSAGFGVRWQSPLGLLRFEWGFPLNKLPYEDASVFQFTIGNFF